MSSVKAVNGITYIDGKPVFMVTADYPYYRDDRGDWSGQLDRLKEMGADVVTCYIPWRHHSVKRGEFDFTGKRRPNTDVQYFLKLIQEKKMKVIVKPGPFIHAETHYGGLPDYVSATIENDIEPQASAQGEHRVWDHPLPAPLGENYMKVLGQWFEAVVAEVIEGRQYPEGPIIGIQILNEGIYTSGGDRVTAYDYSPSGLKCFKEFLRKKYGDIAGLNEAYKTKLGSFDDVYPPREFRAKASGHLNLYLDWAEFSSYFYKTIIERYLAYFNKSLNGLPVYINLNLCGSGIEAEIYPVRNNPHALKDLICWGYTDWAGPLAENEEPVRKYRLVTALARGVCMEENWGFSKIYNPLYRFVQPSFYQTLYYMALGTTGFNIYTGVSTDNWDDHLDRRFKPPYPEQSPVAEDGSLRPQYHTAKQMSGYLKREGSSLVAAEKNAEIAWALYLPYCGAASWLPLKDRLSDIGLSGMPHGVSNGMDTFQRMLAYTGIESGAVVVDEDSLDNMKRYKALCISGGDWIDAGTAAKLIDYVKAGGTLFWTGVIPKFNEKWQAAPAEVKELFPEEAKIVPGDKPAMVQFDDWMAFRMDPPVYHFHDTSKVACEATAEIEGKTFMCAYSHRLGGGRVVYMGFNPWKWDNWQENSAFLPHLMKKFCGTDGAPHVRPEDRGKIEVYQHDNRADGTQYIYVLSRSQDNNIYTASFKGLDGKHDSLEVMLTGYSGALVCVKDGLVRSALVKGINDEKGTSTAPLIRYRGRETRASAHGDLYFVVDGGKAECGLIARSYPAEIRLQGPKGEILIQVEKQA